VVVQHVANDGVCIVLELDPNAFESRVEVASKHHRVQANDLTIGQRR
jgi:hypothetical protein